MWISKKKMIISFMLMSLFVGMMAGCSKEAPKQPEDILYENGLKMINTMDEMVHSEYYQYFTAPSEEMQSVIGKIADGNYSAPKAVYKVGYTQDEWKMVEEFLAQEAGTEEITKDLSENLKKDLCQKVFNSMATMITARSGATSLAAASVFRPADTFVCEGLSSNQVYVYCFEQGYPIMVTFVLGQDDSVQESASFIIIEEASLEELLNTIQQFSEFEITEITRK